MLDVGWGELFLIGVVALIVVGPKDLPALFRTVGQFTGRARAMARDFQRAMEAAADESGVKDAASQLKALDRLNYGSATSAARSYAKSITDDIDRTVEAAAPKADAPAAAQAEAPAVAGGNAAAEVAPPAKAAEPAGAGNVAAPAEAAKAVAPAGAGGGDEPK